MSEFVVFITDGWELIMDTLNSYHITLDAYHVPIGSVLVAFLIISIVITVFWKGGGA